MDDWGRKPSPIAVCRRVKVIQLKTYLNELLCCLCLDSLCCSMSDHDPPGLLEANLWRERPVVHVKMLQ